MNYNALQIYKLKLFKISPDCINSINVWPTMKKALNDFEKINKVGKTKKHVFKQLKFIICPDAIPSGKIKT